MTITLRPYQSDMVAKIYQNWQQGNRNVLGVLPTGAGKSVCISQVALDRDQMGANQCIMAHRTELVSQMAMHIARREVKHRIIAPDKVVRDITRQQRAMFGRSFVNPDARCAVAAAQTLSARAESLKAWGATVHNWTVDECFPAGTQVRTICGDKPIQDVKIGDMVVCFDEKTETFAERPVTHTFKNVMHSHMMRLQWGEHHVIETTTGHPFWTLDGWKKAVELTEHDWILADVSLHSLREGSPEPQRTSDLHVSQNWAHFLHGQQVWLCVSGCSAHLEICQSGTTGTGVSCGAMYDVCKTIYIKQTVPTLALEERTKGLLFNGLCYELPSATFECDYGRNQPEIRFRTDDKPKPDEKTGDTGQGFTITKSDKSPTTRQRWQWSPRSGSGDNVRCSSITDGVCSPVGNPDQDETWFRLSDMLQAGHGSSGFEDCFGGGRNKSSLDCSSIAGCEERRVFNWVRLESVEVYQPSNNDRSHDGFVYNIEVCGIHTYIANGVVVHNCHHLTAKNLWGRAVGLFPNALGLGVTATPSRADGLGLGRHADGLIDAMLIGPSMRELIDEGSLTDYEIAVPQSDFHIDDEAVTNSGDYSPVKMREASKKSHITGDVVKEYSQRAFGRRAICFATDVQTANEIANNFNAAGIPAASVSAQTPTEVRADFIRKFSEGLLWVLVNVDLFDEGFDAPGCDVVIMARPTASLCKFMQQFGRALRPDPNNPSKVALVIDHVSNWLRHGLPDKPRSWTLDRREKRAKKEPDPEEIPLTVCRSCSRPYERFHAACPYCGEQPVAAGGTRNIEQVDGDLLLLDREKLAEMRKAIELESPASVSERVGFAAGPLAAKGAFNAAVARHEAQQRLSDAIAQWAALERAKGRPDSQTYRRFFLTTGQDVLTALTGKRDEMDRLANMVEGWYK